MNCWKNDWDPVDDGREETPAEAAVWGIKMFLCGLVILAFAVACFVAKSYLYYDIGRELHGETEGK